MAKYDKPKGPMQVAVTQPDGSMGSGTRITGTDDGPDASEVAAKGSELRSVTGGLAGSGDDPTLGTVEADNGPSDSDLKSAHAEETFFSFSDDRFESLGADFTDPFLEQRVESIDWYDAQELYGQALRDLHRSSRWPESIDYAVEMAEQIAMDRLADEMSSRTEAFVEYETRPSGQQRMWNQKAKDTTAVLSKSADELTSQDKEDLATIMMTSAGPVSAFMAAEKGDKLTLAAMVVSPTTTVSPGEAGLKDSVTQRSAADVADRMGDELVTIGNRIGSRVKKWAEIVEMAGFDLSPEP